MYKVLFIALSLSTLVTYSQKTQHALGCGGIELFTQYSDTVFGCKSNSPSFTDTIYIDKGDSIQLTALWGLQCNNMGIDNTQDWYKDSSFMCTTNGYTTLSSFRFKNSVYVSKPGKYQATFGGYAMTGSCDPSIIVLESDATGIRAKYSDNVSLNVFPNPANNEITIDIKTLNLNTNEKATITLTSLLGQVVSTEAITNTDSKYTANINTLQPGIYTVSISSGEKKYLQKFIKL